MRSSSRPSRNSIYRARSSDRMTDFVTDRLSFLDQTTFELLRATGRRQLMQGIWIYQRPVDLVGLQQVNRRLGDGLLGRRIERSPLPWGRPRWVASPGPTCDIELPDSPWPREQLLDWADEQAALPLDPEFGPGWRLGAVRLDDGSMAVTLVVSHCIADGGGTVAAVLGAIHGVQGSHPLPLPHSRKRLPALLADFGQSVRDVPAAARAFSAAVRLAVRSRRAPAPAAPSARSAEPDGSEDRTVAVPSTAVFVPVDEWDAAAKALGGNTYSLLAGVAARFAERMGRCRASDGAVTLVIAINDRTGLSDTRAIAMGFAKATLDPKVVTTDLSQARVVLKEARQKAQDSPDPALELVPLVPWLPQRAVKSVVNALFAYSEDLPASCSNMGELPPESMRIDGSDADYLIMRGTDQGVTAGEMARSHGQLVLVSGRVNGKISISVEAYQPGAENTRARLREMAAATLTDFGLCGVIE